ncbi:MAG: TonB-dependent receptor, partial [Zoogloeaceae bacterium]|nr:TonB-dependent receptor [Zoogloeaceae bacterium]
APGNAAGGHRADFRIQTYGLNGFFNLSDTLKLHVDPYYVRVTDGTASAYARPLSEAAIGRDLNGDGDRIDLPPVIAQIFPTQYRVGVTSYVDWTLDTHNELQLGYWHDYIHARNQTIFQSNDDRGRPTSIHGNHAIVDSDGHVVYGGNNSNRIISDKLWIQDTWSDAERWSVTGGLAWQRTAFDSAKRVNVDDPATYKRSASYNRLLPSLKVSLDLNERQQIFYSAASTVKVPLVATLYTPPGTAKQKPEKAFNQELGWRYHTSDLLLGATLFYNVFKDRQASTTVNGVATDINAGDVNTWGIEFSANGKFARDFNYFASLSHTRARQREDVPDSVGTLADTQGKQLFNTPKTLASLGVGYDDGKFYANLLGRYVGNFYGDLENREKIGDYTVVDAGFGYRLKWEQHTAVLRLNLNNLFDKHYLSGVATGVVSIDSATPQYYRGQPRGVFASLTIDY